MKEKIIIKLGIFLIAFVVALLGIAWVAYDIGVNSGRESILHGEELKIGFERQAISLKNKNRSVHEDLALMRRQIKIDQATIEELKRSYMELQAQLSEAKEELKFYRQIVAPEKSSDILSVHDFKVFPQKEENTYNLRLTLVQSRKRRETLVGKADIKIEGSLKGKMVTYSYKDIALNKEKTINFSFKYFQKLDLLVELPKGFKPTKVYLQNNLKWKNKKVFEGIFSWSELL